jgi:hypothetical protein
MRADAAESRQSPGKRRRSTAKRGYGEAHQARRRLLTPFVDTGMATCARCGKRIEAGEAWDLGHSDDRSRYSGPEHMTCNRGAPNRLNVSRQW